MINFFVAAIYWQYRQKKNYGKIGEKKFFGVREFHYCVKLKSQMVMSGNITVNQNKWSHGLDIICQHTSRRITKNPDQSPGSALFQF